MKKNRILSTLFTEWNQTFPNENVYFSFQIPRYSKNYRGIRREAFIHLKYFSDKLSKKDIAMFCRRFNSKRMLLEF